MIKNHSTRLALPRIPAFNLINKFIAGRGRFSVHFLPTGMGGDCVHPLHSRAGSDTQDFCLGGQVKPVSHRLWCFQMCLSVLWLRNPGDQCQGAWPEDGL